MSNQEWVKGPPPDNNLYWLLLKSDTPPMVGAVVDDLVVTINLNVQENGEVAPEMIPKAKNILYHTPVTVSATPYPEVSETLFSSAKQSTNWFTSLVGWGVLIGIALGLGVLTYQNWDDVKTYIPQPAVELIGVGKSQ